MRTNAFDHQYTTVEGEYSIAISFDKELQLNTIDNGISLYDSGNDCELYLSDVVYTPQTKTLVITTAPEVLSSAVCRAELGEMRYLDVTCLDESTVSATLYKACDYDPFGVSVVRFAIHNDIGPILTPKAGETITLKVVMVNASNEEQTKELLVYLNENEENYIVRSMVTIPANTEREFVFVGEGVNWKPQDILSFTIN